MADSKQTVLERLAAIQGELKVKKGQLNSFGGYMYRSKEDILEAAKPLCHEAGLALLCDDQVTCLDNGWCYVVSTASVTDVATGESVSAHGLAREQETKKGMDASQITGTCGSYAGKRALGNLFAIDDTADSDAPVQAPGKQPPARGPFTAHCRSCGSRYQFQDRGQMESMRCCPNPDWEVE
ncbi:MAG: ERF family protein [Atopobiaceae bacterium]|jgi:hypothetical protein|nr:ERF family protein [Atopobiaceae bacterium]